MPEHNPGQYSSSGTCRYALKVGQPHTRMSSLPDPTGPLELGDQAFVCSMLRLVQANGEEDPGPPEKPPAPTIGCASGGIGLVADTYLVRLIDTEASIP